MPISLPVFSSILNHSWIDPSVHSWNSIFGRKKKLNWTRTARASVAHTPSSPTGSSISRRFIALLCLRYLRRRGTQQRTGRKQHLASFFDRLLPSSFFGREERRTLNPRDRRIGGGWYAMRFFLFLSWAQLLGLFIHGHSSSGRSLERAISRKAIIGFFCGVCITCLFGGVALPPLRVIQIQSQSRRPILWNFTSTQPSGNCCTPWMCTMVILFLMELEFRCSSDY